MIGITAFGGYVPVNRLDRKYIKQAFGKTVPPGEKAVANYDEDSLTMGVAASLECCRGMDTGELDQISFASTTAPYAEKQCATTLAAAMDAGRNVRTADYADTLRAGSAAMLSALDAAALGKKTLVAVSDSRLGGADGPFEAGFGDGAAAFTFGDAGVIAEFIDSFSVAVEFPDLWRSKEDSFVRSWEERFGITQGYFPFVTEAVLGVMEKTGAKPEDFSRIVLYAMAPRYQTELAGKLGFQPGQIQDSLYATVGNAGAANAPMMLAAALEQAKPGDKILFVTYGEGSDALIFRVTEEIAKLGPRRGIQSYLNRKRTAMNYEKYLRWRELIHFEPAKRPPQLRSSLPDFYRNYKKNYALYGCRCTVCATPQFPPGRVCVQCQAVDKMEPYRFYGKTARVATYTFDYLALSLDPPNVVAVVDFEGGGRMFCNLVDCDLDKIKVGMEVEMAFRKLFSADGICTYFWKAVPKAEMGGERNG